MDVWFSQAAGKEKCRAANQWAQSSRDLLCNPVCSTHNPVLYPQNCVRRVDLLFSVLTTTQ